MFVRDADSREASFDENRAVFRRGLQRTLVALRDAGKHVFVVGPIPEVGFDVPTTLARNLWFRRGFRIEPTHEAFMRRQQFVLDTLTDLQSRFGYALIRPDHILCDDIRCSVGTDDRPLYVDDNHLSITGARMLQPLFQRALADAATKNPAGVP
jgi:hypothetical protein